MWGNSQPASSAQRAINIVDFEDEVLQCLLGAVKQREDKQLLAATSSGTLAICHLIADYTARLQPNTDSAREKLSEHSSKLGLSPHALGALMMSK